MKKKLRLVIAVPSGGSWDADFAMSMCFMVAHLSKPIPGFDEQNYRIHNKRSSILANSRQQLVQEALKGGATHLLFVDSDQTFPPDIVARLLSHGKDVVACNIATKSFPSNPTARWNGPDFHGTVVPTTARSEGLETVWRVGTGIMMIDLKIFRSGRIKFPCFTQRWEPELDMYVGEDWAFCEALEQADIPIYVDHSLSKAIGHVGRFNYGHEHTEYWDEPVRGSQAESV